jgi:hypothetical protein
VTGHLARLCLEGTGSTGRCTPHGFDLRLLGAQQAADHIVYLHKVHHAALNDVTAWGSALHVYARLPGAGAPFGRLLYQATARLTGRVEGANRRQLLTTALARFCLQMPIIKAILDADLDEFQFATVREFDRPDARWSWFPAPWTWPGRRRGTADHAVVGEYGAAVFDSDGLTSDLYTATDRSHDATRDRWEAAADEHLHVTLAATLPLNGHQDGPARLLELTRQTYGVLGLRPAMTEEQRRDDAKLAASVLQQMRHDLAGGERYRAASVPSMSADDLVRLLVDGQSSVGGPAMVVDARPADRLAALYRWPPGSAASTVTVRA